MKEFIALQDYMIKDAKKDLTKALEKERYSRVVEVENYIDGLEQSKINFEVTYSKDTKLFKELVDTLTMCSDWFRNEYEIPNPEVWGKIQNALKEAKGE